MGTSTHKRALVYTVKDLCRADDMKRFTGMLKKLGFALICEVDMGADLMAEA